MATRTPRDADERRDTRETEADRVTASLAGLAATLLFVVLGLVLIHHLYDEGRVEDCLMAGRSNCDQIVAAR